MDLCEHMKISVSNLVRHLVSHFKESKYDCAIIVLLSGDTRLPRKGAAALENAIAINMASVREFITDRSVCHGRRSNLPFEKE